jgi:superfamily II DNA or RNA helicase
MEKRKLVTLTDGTIVNLVDGVAVRNTFSSEFIGGGHHLIYDWIPEGEVWIDTEVPEADRGKILFHELLEIGLMRQGWSYDDAHDSANKFEDVLRKRGVKESADTGAVPGGAMAGLGKLPTPPPVVPATPSFKPQAGMEKFPNPATAKFPLIQDPHQYTNHRQTLIRPEEAPDKGPVTNTYTMVRSGANQRFWNRPISFTQHAEVSGQDGIHHSESIPFIPTSRDAVSGDGFHATAPQVASPADRTAMAQYRPIDHTDAAVDSQYDSVKHRLSLADATPRSIMLHEATHAFDPKTQDVRILHPGTDDVFEPEVPAMVTENQEAMRQGVPASSLDPRGQGSWVQDATKKYGSPLTGQPTDVEAVKNWVQNLRGDSPTGRNYRNWLATQERLYKHNAEIPHLRKGVELQPQQKRVVQKVKDLPDGAGLLVYHGLGSGKTISAIAAGDALGGKVETVVPASLRGNFSKELNKALTTSKQFTVKSYQDAVKNGIKPANLTVFDEAHRMGREGTQVSRVGELPTGKKMLLSGTPIRNSPDELVPLLKAMAPDRKVPGSSKSFDDKFVTKAHENGWLRRLFGADRVTPAAMKNEGQFRDLVRGRVDYHASQGNFPSTSTQDIDVEMSPAQSELYRGFGKAHSSLSYKIQHGLPPSKSESAQLNAFLSAVRQTSNNPTGFNTSLTGDPVDNSPKLKRMLQENLKRVKDPSFKSLIYSNYLDSGVEPLAKRLNQEHVPAGVFSGGLTDKARKDLVDRYNSGKLKSLLISGAGSEGLDLKGTQMVQLMEPHWNEARSDQVVGRAVRNDSHAALPEDLRNVLVQRYFTRPKPTFGERIGWSDPDRGVDRYLETLGKTKQDLNDQFLKVLQDEGSQPVKTAMAGYPLTLQPEPRASMDLPWTPK